MTRPWDRQQSINPPEQQPTIDIQFATGSQAAGLTGGED
ncbi:hypothetical protein D1AOALGA4SA_3773 [Olavius algarvensis Delta 1 endosymbiont]|nr:hypothetical protein D1AOALGA4SA_3773 [Olavius algarvensis Delta 1 endosymbiont]